MHNFLHFVTFISMSIFLQKNIEIDQFNVKMKVHIVFNSLTEVIRSSNATSTFSKATYQLNFFCEVYRVFT